MFKFPEDDELKKIANLQITNKEKDAFLKISESEYSFINQYINDKSDLRILDLGCGLGRASIYLNSKLKNNPFFIMADYNEVSEKVKYGWNPHNSVYNSLDKTSDFLRLNGVNNFKTFNLKNNSISGLKDIDIIMSFLSVGFHYNIEPYLDSFNKILKDDGIIILGIRCKDFGGIYDEDYFKSTKFKVIKYFKDYVDLTKERIMILKRNNLK